MKHNTFIIRLTYSEARVTVEKLKELGYNVGSWSKDTIGFMQYETPPFTITVNSNRLGWCSNRCQDNCFHCYDYDNCKVFTFKDVLLGNLPNLLDSFTILDEVKADMI